MSKPSAIETGSPRAGSAKPLQLRIALNMPVSVWVEGEDPEGAVAGHVFLVGRDFLRVRAPKVFPPGTPVRFKTQARTRSLRGEVRGGSSGNEMFISSEGAAAYFGIAFPSSQETSGPPPQTAPEQTPEEEPAPAPANEPAPVQISAPELVTTPETTLSRQLSVVVSGIDAARCSFSQAATATLDASGACRLDLPQVLALGARVRLAVTNKDRTWNCRVYSLGAARTPEGRWTYRLVFEDTLDLFREFEPPSASGSPTGTNRLLLTELNALRSVVVALLYELRQRGILTDDKLLSHLLGDAVPPELE